MIQSRTERGVLEERLEGQVAETWGTGEGRGHKEQSSACRAPEHGEKPRRAAVEQ